jgi:hypothetical protein
MGIYVEAPEVTLKHNRLLSPMQVVRSKSKGGAAMSQQAFLSMDTRFDLNVHTNAFPFAYELSLAPLIGFWQEAQTNGNAVKGALATVVREALQHAPALCEPITDMAVITAHQDLVDVLMTVAFPPALWEQTYAAALLPYHFQSFYATPSFQRLLVGNNGALHGRVNADAHTVDHVRVLHAYAFILQQVYGIELGFEHPIILTVIDPDTGLDRHFRLNFDGRFLHVRPVGDPPPLSEASHRRLMANLADPQVLMELLPPECFTFHGFTVLNAVEVTDQEVLSLLKRDLIEKESIVSNTRFQGLQDKLRTLFRKPDLIFGLASIHAEQVFMLNAGTPIEYG